MKIFEYDVNEISTPTGRIFMRFGFKKTGSGKLDDEGKPETYLVGWAGFGNEPTDVRYGNARVKFDNLATASDLVHAVKEVLGDTQFGKVFISAKTLEIVPIDYAPPHLDKFFDWVEREGGERMKLWQDNSGWEPEKKDNKVEIKGRKRKKNPMKGKPIRDIPQGETKKTVTFTVGSRFYREIQNNLPNIMKYRGPNGTFVMPNDIFAAFKKQAEAKFPFADIKVQNRVATGESIPGTFVDPSDDARQQAKAVMQKDADAAVVGRAKMGITDVDEGSDKSAHDCGIVDGYYGRQPNPHKIEMGQRIKLTDPKEINDYMMGYKDDSAGSKTYENGITSSSQPDHEASMAKGELYNTIKNAKELFHMIEDGENLEGWVASKLTKAADYINSVHDYMMYEKQYSASMNEVGDTKRGQKLINKVHKRASDRLGKAVAKGDAKNAKKYQDVGQQAWDRMPSDKYDESIAMKKKTSESLGEAGFMDKVKGALGMGKKDAPAAAPAAKPVDAKVDTPPAPKGAKVKYKGEEFEKVHDGSWESHTFVAHQKTYPREWKAIEAEYAKSGQAPAAAKDPFISGYASGGSVLKRVFGGGVPMHNVGKLLGTGSGNAAVVLKFPNDKFYEIKHLQGEYSINSSKETREGYYRLQKTRDGRNWERGEFKPYNVSQSQIGFESVEEDVTDEGGPASRSLCRSKKPDSSIGASNLASCVSQGLRAHKSGRADYVSGKQLRVGGKKIKGKAHGGPLPDYS